MNLFRFFICLIAVSLPIVAIADNDANPVSKSKLIKVAVTDLTYKKELSRKINFVGGSEKSSVKAKGNINERESQSLDHYSYSRNQTLGDSNIDRNVEIIEGSKTINYLQVGELRSITGDIKGEMLKSGAFRLMQGKPYTSSKESEEIYDVIKRIKEGYYPGADYVLFGSLIDVQSNDEVNPIQGSDSVSKSISIEVAAEFNLINTKTLEVISAFSASGEGSDLKLLKPGSNLKPSRVKATKAVSKSLAEDVITQLTEQLSNH